MRFFAKLLATALAAVSLAAVPAAAGSRYPKKQGGGGKRCKPKSSYLELVLCASGEDGFDGRKKDFDILRTLVVTGGLVEALESFEDTTLFMPNDKAFEKLARDLGYDEDYDEEVIADTLVAVLSAIGEALDLTLEEVIGVVIGYHVAIDGAWSFKKLKKGRTVGTLGDLTIESRESTNKKKNRVVLEDNAPGVTDPRIHDKMRDLKSSQGIAHVITRVLLPVPVS